LNAVAQDEPEAELFWLAPQVDALRKARTLGRLPQALLIQDRPGAGGVQLAQKAAQVALCTEENFPCGHCRECRRVLSQSHPDVWWVTLEEDASQIGIDQIRALNQNLALTAHGSSASVAIIHPADLLNASSANALLKTLEEPRAGVLIVLVAAVSARLPATVLSRCLRLPVVLPSRATAAAWLRRQRGEADWEQVLDIVGGAPLRALSADPSELLALRRETEDHLEAALAGTLQVAPAAERWAEREGFELRLHCAENWVTRRLSAQLPGGGDMTELHTAAHLPAANSSMNIQGLIRLMDALYELRRLASTQINKALAVEQLLWQLRTARKS
jgi:DNA polymerase-3 subunit delta'